MNLNSDEDDDDTRTSLSSPSAKRGKVNEDESSDSSNRAQTWAINKTQTTLEKYFDTLLSDKSRLEQSIEILLNDKNRCVEAISDLKKSISDLKKAISDLKKAISDLKKAISDLKKALQEREKTQNELENCLKKERSESNWGLIYCRLYESFDEVSKTHKVNTKDIKDKEVEIKDKEVEIKDKEAEIKGKEAEVKDKEAEIKIKEAEIKIKEAEMAKKEKDIKDINDKIESLTKSRSQPVVVSFSSKELDLVNDAMKIEAVDKFHVSKKLDDHIRRCSLLWCNGNSDYYAPYFALIGPSMIGKTFLLKRISEMKQKFVVYVCLRPDNSSGRPRRTPKIADMLLNTKSSEDLVSQMFWTFYLAVFRTITMLMKVYELGNAIQNFNSAWFDVCCGVNVDENNPFLKSFEREMALIQTEMSEKKLTEKVIVEEMRNIIFPGQETFKDQVPILFCFDEARSLMSNSLAGEFVGSSFFVLLRRVLCEFPSVLSGSVLCPVTLFTDTTSRIGNISPTLVKDPSFRVNTKGLELFPPFYYMDNIDILADSFDNIALDDLDNHFRLFRMGRPFWGACIIQKNGSAASVLDDIVNIAKSKIVGGTSFNSWLSNLNKPNGSWLNDNEVLSILGSRLAINICPYSQVSHSLVSDFLALCLWISEDRRALASKMCSEPILSHASAIIFDRMETEFQVKSLDFLAQNMEKGIVEAGYRGELVSRLLLLLAWDSVWKHGKSLAKDINITRKARVKDYLQHLLSEEVMNSLRNWTFLENGDFWVFFTHFISLNYTPRKSHILFCMKRGAAIICRQNEWGIDLIIPMIKKAQQQQCPKNPDSPPTMLLEDDDVSFILISVKNYRGVQSKAEFEASSTYKMDPVYVGIVDRASDVTLPYITLYMNVGSPTVGFLSRDLYAEKRVTRSESLAPSASSNSDATHRNLLLNHNLCLFGMDASIYNKCWLTDDILPALVDLREARLDCRKSAPLKTDQSHIILALPGEYSDYAEEITKYNDETEAGTDMEI